MHPESDDAVPTIPGVVSEPTLDDYLEVMTRAVFQTGLSWAQIARHWKAYRRAFVDFDCPRVAGFSDDDVTRALLTPGVLRSPRKVQATLRNARALLALEREHGSVAAYLRSFPDYTTLARALKKTFAFMGEMNAWYFLFRVGEPVPAFDTWVATIPGSHPRMREMVERATR